MGGLIYGGAPDEGAQNCMPLAAVEKARYPPVFSADFLFVSLVFTRRRPQDGQIDIGEVGGVFICGPGHRIMPRGQDQGDDFPDGGLGNACRPQKFGRTARALRLVA